MRALILVAISTLFAVVPASAAADTSDLRLVARGVAGTIRTDGLRYAAWQHSRTFYSLDSRTAVRVYDSRGRRFVALLGGCLTTTHGTPGLFLFTCADGGPFYEGVFGARTRTLLKVTSPNVRDHFFVLGREWLGGRTSDPAAPNANVYLNWHTGERRTFPGPEQELRSRNLDDPGLAPLERPPPFGILRDVEDGHTLRRGGPHDAYLVLERGSRRTVLTRRCGNPGGCHDEQLSAGRVSWVEGDLVYGYDVRRRTSFRWAPKVFKSDIAHGNAVGARHTRDEVLIAAVASYDARGPDRYNIFAARWR